MTTKFTCNIEYRGYIITHNFYGKNEYSVFVDGDDVIFYELEKAKAFIDELISIYE